MLTTRHTRVIIRCLILAAAVVLALPILPWTWSSIALPAASPLVFLCCAVAARAVGITAFFAAPFLLMVLWKRRWVCRWVCPVGLLNEQADRLRPFGRGYLNRIPHLGRWLALVAFAGALVGYPLLLWLDPFALFNDAFGTLRRPIAAASLLPALGLATAILLSAIQPGLWCQRICPLGGLQDLLHIPRIRSTRPFIPSRRTALAIGVGGGAALVGLLPRSFTQAAVLRPPGGLTEDQFTGVCIRCGNCTRACPSHILHPDLGKAGVSGFLAPVMRFGNDYCRPECNACTQVCPSGAIQRITLDQKQRFVIGLAVLDTETCLMAKAEECGICIEACPYAAMDVGDHDGISLPTIEATKCTGCGACQVVCPTAPVKSIRVHPLEKR